MRRVLLVAVAAALALAALALAAPARAMDPPPAVLDFEAQEPGAPAEGLYAGTGASLEVTPPAGLGSARTGGCGVVSQPGHDSLQGLDVCDGGTLVIRFAQPQTRVSMWAAALFATFGESAPQDTITAEAWPGEPGDGVAVDQQVIDNASAPFGVPVVLGADLDAPAIGSVRVFTHTPQALGSEFLVDDIAFGASPSPDTEITSAPANPARSRDATFAFAANQSDTGFVCALDGADPVPCRGSVAYAGLGDGGHTFTVAARDRYGRLDRTPATYRWTVDLTPPPVVVASAPDADRDGIPDARDDCPAAANADQRDTDHDGIGDACETLPSGAEAPVNGETVIVEVLSGEVFVKLPASGARGLAQTAPIPGFVPLKGIAALPTGTVVDTRKGRIALTSTVDGRRIGAGGSRQTATLAAGIFRIRQQRLARGSTTRVPTDLVLTSAPGAEAACVRLPASGPIKGRGRSIVRSLSAATQKGVFRIVGAAGISAARDATWVTQDRCDGTRTDVGKGRVTVANVADGRTLTVRAGRSYLVKARLFAARRK